MVDSPPYPHPTSKNSTLSHARLNVGYKGDQSIKSGFKGLEILSIIRKNKKNERSLALLFEVVIGDRIRMSSLPMIKFKTLMCFYEGFHTWLRLTKKRSTSLLENAPMGQQKEYTCLDKSALFAELQTGTLIVADQKNDLLPKNEAKTGDETADVGGVRDILICASGVVPIIKRDANTMTLVAHGDQGRRSERALDDLSRILIRNVRNVEVRAEC
uniref:Uncharacterized protein n=1 Tax=Romanomermis culicivorax TaxID=13658 RepID=A0A915IGH9_ROMCU